jgi:hypothetical protein
MSVSAWISSEYDCREPEPLGDILSRLLIRQGIEPQIMAARLSSRFNRSHPRESRCSHIPVDRKIAPSL